MRARFAANCCDAWRGKWINGGSIGGHLREEFSNLVDTTEAQRSSIDEVIALVRTYLK